MASLEVARSHGIAKASWMQRQSEILGRWKYSFCVLYRNGNFNFYKDEKMTSQQGSINVPKSCYAINVGLDISGSPPPPTGKDRSCLLELRSHEINVLFCTDSVDDSVTWKSSILEVKNSLLQPAQPRTAAPLPSMAPPPYAATQAPVQQVMLPPVQQVFAPPAQHVQVSPFGGVSTTYTTYQVPSNQYVISPTNQTVIVNGRTCQQRRYPVQNTVYTYPGQTVYTCQAGQNIVTRY